MEIRYSDADRVDLERFGGIDFVIPAHLKRDRLDDVLSHVVLLDWAFGKQLVEVFHTFERYPYPFDWTRYHVDSFLEFDDTTVEDRDRVTRWLVSLPFNDEEELYAYRITPNWDTKGCPVMVLRWRDFATSLWYPIWNVFDVLTLVDSTVRRAVIFGPERCAAFVVEGGVDSSLPKSDVNYGLGLIRVERDPGK